MSIKNLMNEILKTQADNELNKLISACEKGEDIFDALRVEPLSFLDVKHGSGWIRPDGTEYLDYIIDYASNMIVFINQEDGKDFFMDSTISEQKKVDRSHKDDFHEVWGSLYNK